MTRLPDASTEGPVAELIRSRRGGNLTPLDRILLHSPAVAEGWNGLLGAIRDRSGLADDLRELAILRVAVLNRAEYEWRAHEPLARAAGLTEEQVESARRTGIADGLPEPYELVLRYADAMTTTVTVDGALFDRLRAVFDEQDIVELTATVAAYNLVSRFLVALEIGLGGPS
ncbi:carboxymuconolactone decarboxylase family protein [Kutzneria sp. NPDC052558]|uniref:carboxymuconolactone decarboxylase family protein n=1 Tax=Kutzneria sp. NPDC052558 TaxID=3364121 RepID=UPI0037C77EED